MKKIITGLQNTMINNALNTSQAKNKTVPPPPAKPGVPMYTGKPVGPYSPINANIGQLGAEQAKQMVASVVPPPPIAPAADTSMVKSFGGGAENLMMQQSVSDTLTPEMIAQIMGVASGGARVGLTAGFDILPPKPDETEQDYLDKALGAAEDRYKTFSDDVKTAQDAKAAVDKKIVDVLKSTDTTVLQQSIADLVNQTKEISQKVTTARDFFVEKDPKSGKERFTNRGAAVVALQILSQFFGNPVQQTQLSGLVTGLGSRYADEQNKLNEANFKAQLDAYNRKLQGYQAQIGVKQAEARQKLGILQFESEAEKEKLSTAKGLQKAQLDAVNSLTEKVSLEKVKAGSAEEKALVARAYKWLESGDPVFEAAARRVLQTRGYPVDIMPEAGKSLTQKEREAKLNYQLAAEAEMKDRTARERAKLQLQERGVVVDERKIDEQIRHNKQTESISYSLGSQRAAGGGGNKLSWMDKFEFSNWYRDSGKQVSEFDKTLSTDAVTRDNAFRGLKRIATIKNGRWVYDPAKDPERSFSQADVNNRHEKFITSNRKVNANFDERNKLADTMKSAADEVGIKRIIPVPKVQRLNDIGEVIK